MMLGLKTSRIIGLGLAAAITMGVMKVDDVKVGDIIRCESGNGLPPVDVWIGKIESLGDLGIEGEMSSVMLVHLQMVAIGEDDLPEVGHSPFAMTSLQKCDGTKIGMRDKPNGDFFGGYSIWLDAFQNDKAGYFTLSPTDGYWTMLGVLDENGMIK